MRYSKMKTLMASLALVVLAAGPALAGHPGDAGFLSLRLGVGAREAAMGGAGVATTEGASAAYWNPSNLAFLDHGTSLMLQHHRWLGLFDHNAAAVTHVTPSGVFGVLFSGLYADNIDRYGTEPVGIPEGTFAPYDVVLGVSYSRRIGDDLAVGLQAKMLYEKIDVYSDTGWAFDLFVTHRAPMIPGLTFAASATNLGGQMTLIDVPFDLPRTITVGLGYSPETGILAQRLTVTGEAAFLNDTNEKAHLGLEVKVVPELALRAGYRVNYTSQGLTAGAGFRYSNVGVNYAYEDITENGLDPGHKFSLEFLF